MSSSEASYPVVPFCSGVSLFGNTPLSATLMAPTLSTEYMIAWRTASSLVGHFWALMGAKMPMPLIGTGIAVYLLFFLNELKKTPGVSCINCDWPLWNSLTRACELVTMWKVIFDSFAGPCLPIADGAQL